MALLACQISKLVLICSTGVHAGHQGMSVVKYFQQHNCSLACISQTGVYATAQSLPAHKSKASAPTKSAASTKSAQVGVVADPHLLCRCLLADMYICMRQQALGLEISTTRLTASNGLRTAICCLYVTAALTAARTSKLPCQASEY